MKKLRLLLLSSGLVATAAPLVALSAACDGETKPKPNPNPTPEPTPEPTPQPTPQPDPTPNPNPTPEPTPDPTPTPNPNPDTGNQNSNKELFDKVMNQTFPFENSSMSSYAKKGVFKIQVNSQPGISDFWYDASNKYGGWSGIWPDQTVPTLIDLESSGRPLFKYVETGIDPVTGLPKSTNYVTQPSLESYKLRLADAVVVEFADGTKKVYDNDDADIAPQPDVEGKYFANTSYKLTSNNPKSINSQAFLNDLQKAVKMSVRIRKNVKWVDQTGKETKYPLQAVDFWTGFQRTVANDTNYRHENGGSAEIDAAVNKIITVEQFKPKATYGNAYIFDLYNVDMKAILDKEQSVSKDKDGNEYFTLKRLDQNEPAQFLEIIKEFYENYEFVPAPHAYINADYDNIKLDTSKSVSADELKKAAETAQDAVGTMREIGEYWYGMGINTTLFVGKYYATGYNTNTLVEANKLNKHYADQRFVNDKRVIRSYEKQYTNAPLSPEAYQLATLNYYKSGEQASIGLSAIDKTAAADLEKEGAKFGLTYVQAKSATNLVKDIYNSFVPVEALSSDYAHSDVYTNNISKVIFGQPADKVLSAPNVLLEGMTGPAAEFRTILNTAINWQAVVDSYYPGSPRSPWLVPLAPDAQIKPGSSDKTVGDTPRDNLNLLHELFVYDYKTGEKVDLGNGLGTTLTIGDSSSVDKNTDEQFQSAAYKTLQKLMTSLLDELYEKQGLKDTDKLDWKIVARYTNMQEVQKVTVLKLLKTWNALDTKGRLNFYYTIPNAQKDEDPSKGGFYANWYGNRLAKLSGWGYDYDGIGSGLDGFTNQTTNFLIAFGLLTEQPETMAKFEKSFPQTVRVAKAWMEYLNKVEKEGKKLTIPVSQWAKMSNSNIQNVYEVMGQYTYDEANEKFVPYKPEAGVEAPSMGVLSSKFWLEYQNRKDVTKKDLLVLSSELSQVLGFSVDLSLGISKDKFVKTFVNPSYLYPATSSKSGDYTNVRLSQDIDL
ncbi:OppA family ABC transporter substrate-binding lipoprotein [Mycoplasma hafezii]|uniref:OppA family ABC transporter substrate-binding lipoprotein n=1 Tax=Mycoplasma hafezii TaxID=525886 RepID=UPI003CF474D6